MPLAQVRETTAVHTRLLRLALAVDESRTYWQFADPSRSPSREAHEAFEQRWFGAISLARVRQLLTYMRARYGALPHAVDALRSWREMEPSTRRLICHWHLQFDDPIYRAFTGEFLVERRALPGATVTREQAMQWLDARFPSRWAGPTLIQYGRKLLAAASEAGLVTARTDPRKLLWPSVPDDALSYLLYFLHEAVFAGTLAENPYLASVGIDGHALGDRIRRLPDVSWNRMGNVDEFTWTYPDLAAWGRRAA